MKLKAENIHVLKGSFYGTVGSKHLRFWCLGFWEPYCKYISHFDEILYGSSLGLYVNSFQISSYRILKLLPFWGPILQSVKHQNLKVSELLLLPK